MFILSIVFQVNAVKGCIYARRRGDVFKVRGSATVIQTAATVKTNRVVMFAHSKTPSSAPTAHACLLQASVTAWLTVKTAPMKQDVVRNPDE